LAVPSLLQTTKPVPGGDMGGLLREVYEIKANGPEPLLAPLRPK